MNAEEALKLARKAYPNDEELRVAYMLGLNEGYELHRDEMMKEAVEGIVTTRSMAGNIVTAYMDHQFKPGQVVKLIIVKED